MLSKEIREIQIVEDTTLTITSTTTSKPSLQSPLQSIVVVVVVFSVPWVWSGSPRSPHNMHTQVKKHSCISVNLNSMRVVLSQHGACGEGGQAPLFYASIYP